MNNSVVVVILCNLAYVYAVISILGILGWLWFRPFGIFSLPSCPGFQSRLVLYPILGWILLLIGASWLRIPALPFQKTAGILLTILLSVPALYWLWKWRSIKPRREEILEYCKSRLSSFPLLIFLGILGLIPISMLTTPSLYDVGTWGYDRANYVATTNEYLHQGMLEQGDASGGILAPWIALNGQLVKALVHHDFSWNAVCEFSRNPDFNARARYLGLLMRNGGAAMDATFASWFRLNGVQAFTLENYLQFLLLMLAGMWVGLEFKLGRLYCIFLSAVACLWPIGALPTLLDNRDQALTIFLVLILLGGASLRSFGWLVEGLVIGSLALLYIEIFPFVLLLWLLIRIDYRPFKIEYKFIGRALGVGFLCNLPYLLWGTHYLLGQLTQTGTMKLSVLLGISLGYFSGLAGTFAGINSSALSPLLVGEIIAGISFLGLFILGVIKLVKFKRWYYLLGLVVLMVLSFYFLRKGYEYSSYKLSTILFPASIILCALALRREDNFGDLKGIRCALVIGCLPGILLGAGIRSGFYFKGVPIQTGPNAGLENRGSLAVGYGLHTRQNDAYLAYQLRQDIKHENHVAIGNLGDGDIGFLENTFPSSMQVNGLLYNEYRNSFYPTGKFLTPNQRVGVLLLANDWRFAHRRYDQAEDIILLQGKFDKILPRNSYTIYFINGSQPITFLERLYSQVNQGSVGPGQKAGYRFRAQGLTFGVYALNQPAKASTLHFDISQVVAPHDGNRYDIASWKFYINGQATQPTVTVQKANSWNVRLSLPADAAGNVVEFVPPGHAPFASGENRMAPLDPKQRNEPVFKINNFTMEDAK